jgi:2-haloacid dehalogenase
MLLRVGSDIQREEVLCLFAEIEADLQTQSQATSYPKLLRQAFFILTRQLGVVGTPEEEDAFVTSIASWDLFPDSIRAVATMCTQFRLVALANVDQTTYEFSRRRIDPSDILSGAITVTSRFRPDPQSFVDTIVYCREQFDASPEEILIVGSSLYHDLAPAWEMGLSVAWISRDGAVVGSRQAQRAYGNRPCEIFSSLFGFAEWLTQRLTSAEGEPQSSSTRHLAPITNVHTPLQDMSLRHLDSSSIGDLHLPVKTI